MEKLSLIALSREQLANARRTSSGRSAHTIYGGHEHALRQTLVALRAGSALSEHENPGEATLQVLKGRVTLTTASARWEGMTGDHLVIPGMRHGLHAVEDSVVLLTVAKHMNDDQVMDAPRASPSELAPASAAATGMSTTL